MILNCNIINTSLLWCSSVEREKKTRIIVNCTSVWVFVCGALCRKVVCSACNAVWHAVNAHFRTQTNQFDAYPAKNSFVYGAFLSGWLCSLPYLVASI